MENIFKKLTNAQFYKLHIHSMHRCALTGVNHSFNIS